MRGGISLCSATPPLGTTASGAATKGKRRAARDVACTVNVLREPSVALRRAAKLIKFLQDFLWGLFKAA